jgi:16S rRNA (guanine527-N7)-methyltransferase
VQLSVAQADSLLAYLDLLEKTNQTMNLTRIPTEEQVKLHLIDSLTCIPILDDAGSIRILDVGTGAGFPGIPIAATLPGSEVTLLDSTLKKLRFIEGAARDCGITNCSVVHARAEALALDPAHVEGYDAVVSRAVAAYGELAGLLLPLVRPGGIALAMKGAGYEDEMRASTVDVEKLGGRVETIRDVPLPGSDIERHLIVIRKIRSAPAARSTRSPKKHR